MWVLKIKAKEKGGIFTERCKKFKTKVHYVPHNNYSDDKYVYLTSSGYVSGSKELVKKYFESIKKYPKITHFETNNNFFLLTYREKKESFRAEPIKDFYNPRLIFLKPVTVDEDGFEYIELGSAKREDLNALLKVARESLIVDYKLQFLKQQKISDIMIFSLLPKLTDRQREAMMLAVEHEYYGYPRKIKLESLAKIMGISISTYQFHLANAEKKLLPFVMKKF